MSPKTEPLVARTAPAGTPWTREEAIEWYGRACAQLGRDPTNVEMAPYQMAFARLWPQEGIAGLRRACGSEPRKPGHPKGGAL